MTWPQLHAELVLRGYAEQVAALPFDDTLAAQAFEQTGDAVSAADVVFGSIFTVALAAVLAFTKKDATAEEKAEDFGERLGSAKIPAAVTAATMALSGVFVLAAFAGVGTGVIARLGQSKRERYRALEAMLASVDKAYARRHAETARLIALSGCSAPPRTA